VKFRFRDVGKRRLVLMVPEDLFEVIRERTHQARRSRSLVGSVALAKGLGISPDWLKALKDNGIYVEV